MFSRLLLISCICIVIAVILYFFYWNRFIGFLIGRIVRLLYWGTEGPSIRIEIGSIHFSLLAGRILLKDLRYYSTNQTVKVVKGQIQWRYWIRRPTAEEDLNTIRSEEDQAQSPSLRCRVHIAFQGFEWLLYNRSAAYDNIVSQMEGNTPTRPTSRSTEPRHSVSKSSRAGSASPFYPPSLIRTSRYVPRIAKKFFAWTRSQLPSLDPKDLLPLGVEVSKGAIILGNSSTPNLLVAEFQRSEGTFGIVEARSKYDQYRHSLSLKFHSALIRYARNDGYVDPMTSMGELVHGRIIQYSTLNRPSSYLSYRHFIKLWQQLGLSALTSKYSSDHRELHAKQQQTTHRVRNSVKSTEGPVAIGANYLNVEYAIERKILEAPLLELVYYVDVVGEVPFFPDGGGRSQPFDLGNGDVAPEWGFDIIITSGIIRYGPWADRQRVELQKTFFPPTYQNNEQTPVLRPGDKRLWTEMRVFIELRDSTTLHVPFREFSKDWQWDDQVDGMQRQRNRESAVIHLAVGDSSTIKYTLPMIVGPAGYEPSLEVHLDTITVTSSLNDIRLVVAESCRVRGEFPTPREWNVERTWSIAVFLRQPVLYLIRDHINMFIDLGKDWTAGPPSDYQRFIPMIYNFDLALHHYELNTYANDHNIIDKPLVRDENALVTLRGACLQTSVKIPSNTYRPDSTTIPFHIDVPDVSVDLSLPRWHTMAAHAPKEGNSLASVSHLSVTGSYLYFADVREDNVEQLKLQFTAHGLSYKVLGWSIRYFMVMRENYLGTFTHFTTLHEYLEKRKQNLPIGDPIHAKYREGKSNMLHVELLVSVENASLILPAGLPGYESAGPAEHEDAGIGACLYLTVPEVQLQLRLHDYYMDMSLNTDTLSGMILSDYPQRVSHSWIPPRIRNDTLLIDSVDITANRLFGPQPRTATYLCIWEIRVGRTKAVLSPAEFRILLAAMTAFRLNFADLPNAPAEVFQPAADPDATFIKVSFGRLDVTWKAGLGAVVLNIPFGGNIDSNDLAGQYHRKVTSIRVPEVSMKALLSPSIEVDRWLEAADVSLDISLDIYSSPRGLESISETQRSYMEEQDRLTGRAHLLLASLRGDIRTLSKHRRMHYKGLYLPQPAFPELGRDTRHGRREQTTSVMQPPDMKYSSMAQFSESDEDQEISEADRDAHLARLRLANAAYDVANEDDQNMTSGDESDNEDLTDVTSDSDWLESMEFTDNDESLFACYSRLTRHYMAPTLLHPLNWEGSPFSIMKEYHPPEFANIAKQSPNHRKNPSHEVLPAQTDAGNLTSYRLKSRDGVQARMTPLVVRLLGSFKEETEEQPLSPELWIDSFLSTYLTEIFPRKSPGDSATYFEISSPSVLLSFPQKISIADLRSMSSVNLDDEMDLLCTVAVPHASLTGLHISGFTSHRDVSCMGGFERLVIALQMLPIGRHPSSLHLGKQVFDFEASDFRAELIKEGLRLEWDHTTTNIDHVGPENVIATFLSFREALSSLQTCIRRWNNHCSDLGQIIVANIITSSTNRAIIDPLSTIQHSYLVQQGKPRQLRTDTTFRFLFHLRNCLWHLGSEQKGKFHRLQNMEAFSPKDFKSLLELRLSEVDQDSYQGHLSSLESLFSILRASQAQSTPRSRLPYSSFHMKFTGFSVLITDPTSASPSKFDVTETALSGFTREFETTQSFPAAALSQTSFRERSARKVTKTSVSAVLGDISLIVLPHLIRFTHHLLRVRRYLAVLTTSNLHKTVTPSQTSAPLPSLSNTEIAYALRSFKIQAVAQDLALEFVVLNTHGILTSLVGVLDDKGLRMNNSLLFSQIYLRARSLSDAVKENDQDVLASLELSGGKLHNASTQDLHSEVNQRLVFSLAALRFRVPRSALRLYRFADQWRADFLTEVEATMQALLGELQASSQETPEQSRSLEIFPSVEVQGNVTSLNISLQVMHGTWLSWEAYHAITYMNTAVSLNSIYNFGFQVASMALSIWSKPVTPDVSLGTRVGIALPRVSITGQHSGGSIDTRILVDFIDVKVKPSHLDTLLAVQQKFGQDFNDLMTLIRETRAKRRVHHHETPSVKKLLSYSGFLKVRGFRMGFEGVSSILYLECSDVGGGLKNHADLVWDVKLLDLAFSLAPRTFIEHRHGMFDRNHCSAFVIVDFKVSAVHCKIADMTQKEIQVSITKIHAVMQPSSIGEIGDFIDHLQAEVLERKEQRALELAAFKEKAQNLLRTFEVGLRDSETANATPWFDQFDVNVSIRNVGFAFPLTRDEDLELPRPVSKDSYAVRAFLFSIRSIEFGFHRGESGRAIMKSFSFQFVSRFRQRVPDDYSGENHQTLNRLTYPEMKAYLRSMRSASFRRIWIDADVDGFYLDLDSSIPSYIFSLVDVYHQGKARVERLSASMPRTSSPYTAISEEDIQKLYNTLPTANVLASMVFHSGKVRMYSESALRSYRSKQLSFTSQELSDEQVMAVGAEVFSLPDVSVWSEYQATPAPHKFRQPTDAEPSLLMFKSTVHSSQNILRPTLLPFLTELVNHVETRLGMISPRTSIPSESLAATASALTTQAEEASSSALNVRISFSLRIDKSKLELTCQPDVNVIAGLHWESGGFVVNVSPMAHTFTFTGAVGGLTVGLRHGFLSEDCLSLDARNLAFSVSVAKYRPNQSVSTTSISSMVDTEFHGVVRFSRLQDILCFKAVWLDRIPIFNRQPTTPGKAPPSSALQPTQPPKSVFITAILARIRQITLEVDLGQSISTITLNLRETIVRTKLTEYLSEVFIFVAEFSMNAKGNIAGYVHVPDCVFQTIRSTEIGREREERQGRMLELRMTSGALVIALESDHQKLVRYRAEPLAIEVFDDWSKTQPATAIDISGRFLQLSFTVTSPEIVAVVTVGTIPKLMTYANKFRDNLNVQRQGASRESRTFRVTLTPKPDNPLSAVAEAMLISARTRFKEADAGLSYVILQHMSLRLKLLRLIVFPRTMDDLEMAHFVGHDVRARLDRLVDVDSIPCRRDLRLSFSSMTISKFSQLGHPQATDQHDIRDALKSLLQNSPEAIIVGLPSMTIHMVSEEKHKDDTMDLIYDFESKFVHKGISDSENIYITLNVALYSWLTVLRKNLAREMDQVKSANEWRALISSSAGTSNGARKRVPEPLPLDAPSKRQTAMEPTSARTSPFSPTTALRPSPGELTRSLTVPHTPGRSPTAQTPAEPSTRSTPGKRKSVIYCPRNRHIERLTMRQLGEATPDVMHPFFMKKAGFNLEDSFPQYVHEYATTPLEEIMEVLLKLYSRQLLAGRQIS